MQDIDVAGNDPYFPEFMELFNKGLAAAASGQPTDEINDEVYKLACKVHGVKPFCDLKGSPKQVAWAEEIRDEHVAQITRHVKSCQNSDDAEMASNAKLLAELTDKAVEEISDAKWWIDHRDELATALLERHRLAEVAFAALDGSEKQVSWAEDIRARVYSAAEAEARKIIAANAGDASEKDIATANANVEKALETLRNETDAKWWIDHRRMEFRPMGLLVELVRAAQ